MGFCCLPSLSAKPNADPPPTFSPASVPPTAAPPPAATMGARPAHPPPAAHHSPASYAPPPAYPPHPAYPSSPVYGMHAAYPVQPAHAGYAAPAQTALSEEQILFFAEHGYLHLRGVVPAAQVNAALSVIDAAYAAGDHGVNDANPTDVVPAFRDNVSTHRAVIAPLAGTALFAMVEQLIGRGCAWEPQRAQVALREPSAYHRGRGLRLHDRLPRDGWHIDGGTGRYATTGSPFTLLVGVALSEGQQEDANHGQFLVWPGSHRVLHAGVAERVRRGLIKDPHSIFAGPPQSRPDIGEPVRVLMSPGDAVLAHQRLGHAGGPNVGEYVRKNLYLRVHNRRHDEFLASGELLNGSVFTEYHGVQEVLRKRGILM